MIEFAQPAALWTGLAIGLPVLAHMAYRTITQKYPFPSLRFIHPSTIPRTGRKTPSDWVLLAARILLFASLTLLLADPYWKSERDADEGARESQTVVAVDLSPSMSGWGGLEEAGLTLRQLIDSEGGVDKVVGFGGEGISDLPKGDPEEGIGFEHGWKKGDAQVLLDGLDEVFDPGAKDKKLIIVSDFQASDWQSAYRDLGTCGVEYQLLRVGENLANDGRSQNQSIVEARAVPVGSDKIRVWVVVRNWVDGIAEAQLSLLAGGAEQAAKTLTLNPLGSAQTQFILDAGNFSKATVRLKDGDSYALDDERTLWLKAPPARNFGFWLANENEEDTREEFEYLRTAVLSSGDGAWNRWVSNQDLGDALRLGGTDAGLDLLFGLGVGPWFEGEGLPKILQTYLENGGVALLTPSEPVSASVSLLNQTDLMKFGFSKVEGGVSRDGEVFRMAALSESSLLGEVFSGKYSRDLYLTSFFRFACLKGLASNLKVPIEDRKGRPLAIVRDFDGGGRLVFLPFRISPRWTDLPVRNCFLPMLMELVGKGTRGRSLRAWPVLEAGEEWSGEKVFRAGKPGAYRFEDQWIEVIPSLAESSPLTLADAELSQCLGGPRKPSKAKVGEPVLGNESSDSLWLWFAIAVAILLIVEMIWSRPKFQATANGETANA